jgi:hypothetical protein
VERQHAVPAAEERHLHQSPLEGEDLVICDIVPLVAAKRPLVGPELTFGCRGESRCLGAALSHPHPILAPSRVPACLVQTHRDPMVDLMVCGVGEVRRAGDGGEMVVSHVLPQDAALRQRLDLQVEQHLVVVLLVEQSHSP